ncbi:MAG TPA: phosphatidylglycerophosphatase A [Vicinamibacteria bacterium]
MSATEAAVPRRGGIVDTLATVVATGLGSGYSPIAPGTAGSAVGLALLWLMRGLSPLALAAAIVAVSAVGVAAATRVARRVGLEDPGLVVIDEVAGMWVTLWLLPFTPLLALLGFVAFRVMDVWKPWPARSLEHLPRGWGIMADDLMAGVYANLLLRVLLVSGLVGA